MDSVCDDRDFLRYRDLGDVEALARFFDAAAPRLLLVAAHLVRHASDAEDLMQTTFTEAMRDAKSYRGEGSVLAWMATILRRRAVDLARQRRARPEGELPDHSRDADEPRSREPGPLDAAVNDELFERVVAAVERIEEPFRTVLLMRLVHGFEPTVIAHTLGRAPGTVRMQLKRGLERLRGVLPASLGASLAAIALDGRGLAAVRETVLASVPVGAGAAVVAPITAAPLVAILAMKKWIAAVALVFISAAVWFVLDESDAPLAHSATRATELSELARTEPAAPLLSQSPTMEAPRNEASARTVLVAEVAAPSLVVTVRELGSGAPRSGLVVELTPRSGGAALVATTETDGAARFETGLVNGAYVAALDRVRGVRAVEVDGPTRIDWHVLAGISVSGRVLTLAEEPAPFSRIWRLDGERPNVVALIAQCDEAGRFAIDGLEENVELVATLAGHQRSEPKRGRVGNDMRFVLGARGHRVFGRVTDETGTLVPFARLVLASDEDARDDWLGSSASPETNSRAKPLDLEGSIATADSEGRYACDEIPAGFVSILARSADPASPLVGFVTTHVAFEGEAQVDVVLERGARLFGRVRAANGAPIADALVAAQWEGTHELGQLEDDVGVLLANAASARTDANGAYEVVGLLPGEHDVLLHSSEDLEWARFDLTLERGEEHEWSPVVSSTHEQRVRLTAHDGAPLDSFDARVVGGAPSTLEGRATDASTSDTDGRLVLFGLEPGTTFDLELWSNTRNIRGIVRRGLVASTDELAVVLAPSEYSRATLTGRVAFPMHLQLVAVESGVARRSQTSRDGAFAFEHVAAGEHRLVTGGNGFPAGEELARVTVLADEPLDIGEVALPPFGRVRLELVCDDGQPITLARADLRASDGAVAGSFRRSSDGWLSTPLRPGPHTLRVESRDAAPFTTTIEVAGQALEHVRVSCPRGAPLRLVIAAYDKTVGLAEAVDVGITDAAGTELVRREFERDEDDTTFEITVHLPPGEFAVNVRDASPARRGTFEARVEVGSDGVKVVVALD